MTPLSRRKPLSSHLLSKAEADLFTLVKEAVEKKVMSLQMDTLAVDSWEDHQKVPVLGVTWLSPDSGRRREKRQSLVGLTFDQVHIDLLTLAH